MTAGLRRGSRLTMAGWVTTLGLSAALPAAAETGPRNSIAQVDAALPAESGFSMDMRLGDVIEHPDFQGFGEHLLPRPGRLSDGEVTLDRIGDLLPYHSNVRPQELVQALDRLAWDVRAGEQVFYSIYTPDEIAADPAKAATGIFLLRGEPGASFAIIAPGGGFSYVGTVHEGLPYATAISAAGLNAFVVRYRVGLGQQAATEDMARAISFIFEHADELGVSPSNYSVWGSSAGARMAALIGTHGPLAFGGDDLPKPSAVIMAYTSHADIGQSEPPTFVIVGERDGIAPPSNMERRVALLRGMDTPVEFRIVPGVGHGFGTGLGTAAEGWINDAVTFWQAHASQAQTEN